jgi:hypothetical protein
MDPDTLIPPEPIPALSVNPVWAWLILHGGKDFENRAWCRRYNARRQLLTHAPLRVWLHAGSRQTQSEYDRASRLVDSINVLRIEADLAPIVLPSIAELAKGGIVGAVTLLGWHEGPHPSPWAEGPGIPLQSPTPLPFRPCKGQLGFFLPKL